MKQLYAFILFTIIITNSIPQLQANGKRTLKSHEVDSSEPVAPMIMKLLQEREPRIIELIGDYAGLNTPNQYGEVPLYVNIQTQTNFKNVQTLDACGAHINKSVKDLLQQAIQTYGCCNHDSYKKAECFLILEYLLQKNISLLPQQFLEDTIMHCAANTIYIPILKILISHNVNLNFKDANDQTPLDRVRKYAMTRALEPQEKRKYYRLCAILEAAGGESSVVLTKNACNIIKKIAANKQYQQM